jgi:hypothetical protein
VHASHVRDAPTGRWHMTHLVVQLLDGAFNVKCCMMMGGKRGTFEQFISLANLRAWRAKDVQEEVALSGMKAVFTSKCPR